MEKPGWSHGVRIRQTRLLGLYVLLLAACSQSEHLDIRTTARIDVGELVAGVVPPNAEHVETPGGVRIPIELSQQIDLIESNPSAVSLMLDGGLVDIRSLRYAITSNTSTVDLPRLLFLVERHEGTSSEDAFGVAILPGGDAESTNLFGDPVWLAEGQELLAYYMRQVRFNAYLSGSLELFEGDDVPTGVIDITLIVSVEVSEL